MINRPHILRAILSKTVARGATAGEEASAVAMAVKLMAKYSIPRETVASYWPKGWDFNGRRVAAQRSDDGLDRILREEAARRTAAWKFPDGPAADKTTSTGTVGDYARQLLMREFAGVGPYSYAWIIEAIKLRYPKARTTVSSLRWYESELRKQGRKVPKRKP